VSPVRDVARLLFDPRGRMSRQDLLVAATVMILIDVAMAGFASGYALYALKAVAYWIGGVGIIKRLHDIGRSGWWFLGGAAGMCIWAALLGIAIGFVVGLDGLQPGTPTYIGLLAALMLPAMGVTLWLHLAAGETGMNRFGAEPSGIVARLLRPRTDGATVGL
jgi:uncharacterized membrane protein YhaH (DUF805 family)